MSPVRIACVQLRSGRDPGANIEATRALVREAAGEGAVYVQTPEMTNILESRREALMTAIRPEAEDPALTAFRQLAAELGIHLHVGSLALSAISKPLEVCGQKNPKQGCAAAAPAASFVSPTQPGLDGHAANRGFLIGPEGEILARYSKIHMFDVDLGSESYRESRSYIPGDRAVVAATPFARIGLSICYDLRFPQLYRDLAQAGAELLAVPSAFTRPTGEAHWHVLLRARAIENGAWVVAAAQGGHHESGRETYGHSLVVAPWGEVVAEGGTEPGVILADIDLAAVAEARRRIPSLKHDRPYHVEAEREPLEQVR